MAHKKAMDVYLNDHLAGAMFGSDLAEHIQESAEGTPLEETMRVISAEIEQDRQSLIDLMEALGTSKNPVKQATTWVAEKASRPKFSGLTSGTPEQGLFMALESLTLGVAGKLSLWVVLKEVESDFPVLTDAALDELIRRAQSQHERLERERVAAGRRALSAGNAG